MSQNNLDNNSNKSPERKKKMNEKKEINSPKKKSFSYFKAADKNRKKQSDGSSNLENRIDELGDKISDLGDKIDNGFSDLGDKIDTAFSSLKDYLSQLFSQYFGGKEYESNDQNNSQSDSQKEGRSYRYPNTEESKSSDNELLSNSKSNKSAQPKKRNYIIKSEIYSRAPNAERHKKDNEDNSNENSKKISDSYGKFFNENETISSLRRKYQNQKKKK